MSTYTVSYYCDFCDKMYTKAYDDYCRKCSGACCEDCLDGQCCPTCIQDYQEELWQFVCWQSFSDE